MQPPAPYIYKATLNRVIDGDTVVLDFDLGFHVFLRDEHCRLAGIDAPEMNSAQGVASKMWLQDKFNSTMQPFTVKVTKNPDKYGRWLVDIYCKVKFDETGQLIHINEEILKAGYALAYGPIKSN